MMNIDFSKCKSQTAIKNKTREAVVEMLINLLVEQCGADNVSIVDKSEISVAITTAKCSDGTENEICFNIKPVVKDFDDRTTESGKKIKAYERIKEADSYEAIKSQKEIEAEEKARKNAEKKERDRIAREKKKAEKEAAKASAK